MIKINRNFSDLAKEHSVRILLDYKLGDRINDKNKYPPGKIKEFYDFLNSNITKILENDITYIENYIRPRVDKILGKKYFTKTIINAQNKPERENKKVIDELTEIFDYKNFSVNKKRKYCAYDLVAKLNINVCPYCNRQYINTLKPANKNGGTRPTLDHFYLKSNYPYLALSFWNLIPSCFSCNSQLRTTKDLGLHPYLKGFEKVLHFYTDITDITEFIGNSEKYFDLKLDRYKNVMPSIEDIDNANKNKEVFRLEEIYKNHKDYVREIIQKTIIYGSDCSKSLYKTFPGAFKDEYDAKNMALSNYTKVEDFEKRPLAKLTRDIAEELKLI